MGTIADDKNHCRQAEVRLMAKPRRSKTPEQRRIAAAQAMIRRCHSDLEFRKQMIAIWRALMLQMTVPSKPGKGKRRKVFRKQRPGS